MAGISMGLTPEAYALLETIAGPESAGAYDVMYGGGKFSGYDDHPRVANEITSGPNKGKTSSAAGKYQFLGSTWDDIAGRYGINDFSPKSQDAAAWALAQEEYKRDTGRSLQNDLASGDISRVPGSLRNQWTSMPGGIEQGITGNNFNSAYWRNMGINPTMRPDINAIDMATSGIRMPAGSVRQGAQPGNSDYMNALADNYVGRLGNDVGLFPGHSELDALRVGRNPLPTIPPSDAQPRTPQAGAAPASNPVGGLFSGLGGILKGGLDAAKGAADTVGDAAIAGGGALRNNINPLQAIAGVLAGKLPDNNAGQAMRAAMGFANPNVGMTLGTAGNGGIMVQGKNGVMNSTTQRSEAWQKATDSEPRYTSAGPGARVSDSGGVYYDRHLR